MILPEESWSERGSEERLGSRREGAPWCCHAYSRYILCFNKCQSKGLQPTALQFGVWTSNWKKIFLLPQVSRYWRNATAIIIHIIFRGQVIIYMPLSGGKPPVYLLDASIWEWVCECTRVYRVVRDWDWGGWGQACMNCCISRSWLRRSSSEGPTADYPCTCGPAFNIWRSRGRVKEKRRGKTRTDVKMHDPLSIPFSETLLA